MVKFTDKRYGIDIVRDRIHVAGRTSSAGRITVDSINEFDSGDFKENMNGAEGDFYFSIPEKDAIIKWVTIPPEGNLDPVKLIQFELAGTLADNNDGYYFDCYYSDPKSKNLAIAYNRNLIEQKISFFRKKISEPSGFKLRSLAMASAYINYCFQEGGKLICLMDISSSSCSYCFMKDERPLLLGGFENGTDEEDKTDNSPDKFVVDMTAMLQYELTKIARDGYSIPLSSIIITGPLVDSEMTAKIEDSMKVRTIRPQLRKELFSEKVLAEADGYLVCLGLTVDF